MELFWTWNEPELTFLDVSFFAPLGKNRQKYIDIQLKTTFKADAWKGRFVFTPLG